MIRAGSSVYTDFYEKYIKTKVLTPKNFVLTFKNKESGATATIRGNWEKNHSLKLLTGEYEVTGTSHPESTMCSDTVYLCFEENISINNETTGINLTAIYDSYLLLLDKSDKEQVIYRFNSTTGGSGSSHPFSNKDSLYYMFFNQLYGTGTNLISIVKNRKTSSIYIDNLPFETGRYYYFNDLSNSFDIPPMEEGN